MLTAMSVVDALPAVTDRPIATVSVAEYLGRRLRQAGVEHLFGVPGDFNLDLLDGLATVDGLAWVGSANELGAGYAADAYARRRGLGVLVTTYGVGELSALNAVAGSAAEDVPVLHVVGSPRTASVAAGALLHHTLADGDFDHFTRAAAEVSVRTEVLTRHRAGEQIDAAVLAAMTHRRPAYLSVPQDVATARVDATPLEVPLRAHSDAAAVCRFERLVRALLAEARRPVVVAGHLVARFGLGAELARICRRSGIPVVTQISARGVVGTDAPFAGDSCGDMLDPATTALVDRADVVLHVGTVLTAELTGFGTARRPDERTVALHATEVTLGAERLGDVLFPDALGALGRAVAGSSWEPVVPGTPARGWTDDPADAGALTQRSSWQLLQAWLPAHTALLADTGTAFWGALSLRLPTDTVWVGQPIWNSIGYALPAVLGQGLADPVRRPVLLIGDGAAQMTVQELGTIAAAGLAPVVVLLDNRGYTIERALQSPDATYNDVPAWDWEAVVTGLTGGRSRYRSAATTDELRAALAEATELRDELVFVHVRLGRDDVPPLLRLLAERATAARG